MSVLIRGMEMPTEPMVLILFPDGNISTEEYEIGANAKAIELPPHGRLIDADMLTTVTEMVNGEFKTYIEVFEVVDAPTIIEAEETNK